MVFDSSYLLWEFTAWRYCLFAAKTSPAMLIATTEHLKGQTFVTYREEHHFELLGIVFRCFEELDQIIRQNSAYEEQYSSLRENLETFLCEMTTLIHSSTELAHLFRRISFIFLNSGAALLSS